MAQNSLTTKADCPPFPCRQTPAILNYLAGEHGYNTGGSPQAAATIQQALLDISDVGSELFDNAKGEKKAKFCEENGRLSNWLKHLNGIYTKGGAGEFLLPGEKPSAGDFMLLSTFLALDFAVGAETVAARCPDELKKWRAGFKARPFVAAYEAAAFKRDPLFASMKHE